MERYDVVVVGGGAMGAATTWALARRGRRVALLERFEPGHVRGSSHGEARVFRLGYDDADHITLARTALGLWRQLERDAQTDLLELTGVVDHGPVSAITPIMSAFQQHGVAHTVLDVEEAASRWPGAVYDQMVLHHPDGGRVRAQRSVDVLHALSRDLGASIRFRTGVIRLEPAAGAVRVVLDDGRVLSCDRVVVTAGAWTAKLIAGLVQLPPLQVSAEQPLVVRAAHRSVSSWIPQVHRRGDDVYLLGVPGEGVKISEHHRDEWLDPDDRPFDLDRPAAQRVSDYIRRWLPGLEPEPTGFSRCLYTTTPDRNFLLDRIDRFVVGAGFSGHGFKFTPAVGEVLADLAEGGSQPVGRWRANATSRTAHTATR